MVKSTSNPLVKRFEALDAFRGIAALAVVLLHFTNGYREDYGHSFNEKYDFAYGYLGVQFFFIISGFVIFLTLNHSKSVGDFLFKRFSRLYPIFWACMLTTFALMHFLGLPGREKSFYNVKGNLSMIPSVIGFSPVDGAYWSLVPEFFFYVIMALLYAVKQKRVYFIWWILILVLSIINKFFFPFPALVGTLLNLKWGSLFFSGMLFYELATSHTMLVKQKAITYLLLACCLVVSMFNLETNTERILVLLFYIVFLLFVLNKLDKIKWDPLLFLGKISFPLYLLHQNIGYIILNYTKPYLAVYPVLYVGVPILLMISMAYLFHKVIEVPSIKLLRALWMKL